MKGSVFRRCTSCKSWVEGSRCNCGADSISWGFRVDVGRRPDGRRQQKFRMGFKTKRDAERALRELLHKVDKDRYVDDHDLNLADFLTDEWLPAIRPPNLRESTWTSYAGEMQRHVIPALGGVKLQNLNAVHLNKLYGDLLASGRKDGKGGLSPRTVRYIHTILRKALSDAVRWGRIERNPADLADPPRRNGGRQRRHMRTWSSAQLARFLDHVKGERLYAAWHVAATTGMRRGEVLGLRWVDVNLEVGRIAVRQTYVSIDGVAQFSEPKTAKSRRNIDLDQETTKVLLEWEERQDAERAKWGEAWEDHGLVFTREDGAPLEPDGFTKEFRRLARAARLPVLRLHDLRHTHATLLLQSRVNPKVASERLGHHSAAFTLDVYSHVVPGMQTDAAEEVAGGIRRHRDPDDTDDTQEEDRVEDDVLDDEIDEEDDLDDDA